MKFRCKRCVWEWEGKVDHPRVCPRCKSYRWDVDMAVRLPVYPMKPSNGVGAESHEERLDPLSIPGVTKGFPAAEEVEMCQYIEYVDETGETYRCGLPVHGPKVRHTRGEPL